MMHMDGKTETCPGVNSDPVQVLFGEGCGLSQARRVQSLTSWRSGDLQTPPMRTLSEKLMFGFPLPILRISLMLQKYSECEQVQSLRSSRGAVGDCDHRPTAEQWPPSAKAVDSGGLDSGSAARLSPLGIESMFQMCHSRTTNVSHPPGKKKPNLFLFGT